VEEETPGPAENLNVTGEGLFYFAKDKNIRKIKFFETEIDNNLKHQVLNCYGISVTE
jgi:hypothetical protein